MESECTKKTGNRILQNASQFILTGTGFIHWIMMEAGSSTIVFTLYSMHIRNLWNTNYQTGDMATPGSVSLIQVQTMFQKKEMRPIKPVQKLRRRVFRLYF